MVEDFLLTEGLLTRDQLAVAEARRVQYGGTLGQHIVGLGFVDELQLAQLLSRRLSVPLLSHDDLLAARPKALKQLSPEVAIEHRAVPVRLEEGTLRVAMADPSDKRALEEVIFFAGMYVLRAVAPESAIDGALAAFYGYELPPPSPPPTSAEVAIYDPQPAGGELADLFSTGETAAVQAAQAAPAAQPHVLARKKKKRAPASAILLTQPKQGVTLTRAIAEGAEAPDAVATASSGEVAAASNAAVAAAESAEVEDDPRLPPARSIVRAPGIKVERMWLQGPFDERPTIPVQALVPAAPSVARGTIETDPVEQDESALDDEAATGMHHSAYSAGDTPLSQAPMLRPRPTMPMPDPPAASETPAVEKIEPPVAPPLLGGKQHRPTMRMPEPPALRALQQQADDGELSEDTQVSAAPQMDPADGPAAAARPPTGPQRRRRGPSREARAAVRASQARRKRPTLQGLPVLKAPHVSTTGDDVLAPTPQGPDVSDRFVRKPRRPSRELARASAGQPVSSGDIAATIEEMPAASAVKPFEKSPKKLKPKGLTFSSKTTSSASASAGGGPAAPANGPATPVPEAPEAQPASAAYKRTDRSRRDDSKVMRLDDLRGKPPRQPSDELPPTPAGWAPSARGLAAKLTQVIARLRHAEDEGAAARATLDFVGIVCERRALLRIKRGVISGWAAAGNRLDTRSVRGLWLPIDPASVFGEVIASRMPFQGPLGFGKAERIFASFIGKHPDDIVVVPVIRDNQVVALIYGDSRVVDVPMPLFRDLAAELALADRRLRR